MSATAIPQSRTAGARWTPSPLLRAVIMLHAFAVALLTAEPEAWAAIFAGLAFTHGTMAVLGLIPRDRLLAPNVTRIPGADGVVALTFDDGPDPAVTPRILDILDAHGAKASFFCIGERVAREPALARDIVRRGHSIENHTHTHPNAFAAGFYGTLLHEVEQARDAIRGATGTTARFFRAPMGLRNPLLDMVLHRAGHAYVSWTRRGFDAVDGNADAVLRRLTRRVRAGDILLLHDSGSARTRDGEPVALAVLPRLLEALAERGLKAVSLPMALGSAPAEAPGERPEHEPRVHGKEQDVVA